MPPSRLRLGNYEPLLQLATGGMATVYVGRQLGAAGFERLVVLKRVHRHLLANHEFHDMFLDEARVASLVRHPNVASVIDVVESEGELFLVMEYVESTALSTLLKAVQTPPLPAAVVARIVADTLSGLHAAHEALDMRGNRLEVVHRDVSPQNIVVGADGASRLIDFGVAKARHRVTQTKSGSLKGKYGYMAPEQTRGLPIDRRADLFAVGVVLHEALTGRRLFQGENEFESMRRVLEADVPDPSSLALGIPQALDAVVHQALARDRELRFQTATEFLEALEGAIALASVRDVAARVHAFCGERLAERRDTLSAILDGRRAPLDAAHGDDAGDPLTLPATPLSRRMPAGEGTESQIAATHDAPAAQPRAGRAARALVVAGLAAGLAVAIAFVAFGLGVQRGSPGAAATAPPRAPLSAPPMLSVSASAAPEPALRAEAAVELRVVADARIESVSANGAREVEISGSRARLVVAPFTGALEISAVLDGHRAARAVAEASGPRELHLVPLAAAPLPAASSARAQPGSRRAPLPPARTSELHSNPYETP